MTARPLKESGIEYNYRYEGLKEQNRGHHTGGHCARSFFGDGDGFVLLQGDDQEPGRGPGRGL